MNIDIDNMQGRVFFSLGYSFMLLGGQPGNPVVYFISLQAEGIGTPLVPISRECLQREIDFCQNTLLGEVSQELLKEQLKAYYDNVPDGGGAYFTCSLSRVVEYAKKASPHIPLAMVPKSSCLEDHK